MVKKDELLRIFAGPIRELLREAAPDWEKVQEIRLRAGRPVFVVSGGKEYVLTKEGLRQTDAAWPSAEAPGRPRGDSMRQPSEAPEKPRGGSRLPSEASGRPRGDSTRPLEAPGRPRGDSALPPSGNTGAAKHFPPQTYMATQQDLRETLEYVGSHSLYAFEDEIRQGFITIQGGHRIGLAGKTVMDARGIRTIKYISFLNVRLAHQVRGCADKILPYLFENGQALHTLFVSPPRCGKTTLLRDVIRQLSDGLTVGVVDERSELAACWQGIPQNDLGDRTDVLDCCPKASGMMMLVRSMSPDVIAVDEIGSREDIDAMRYVMNCGCRVLATVHGDSAEAVAKKPVLGEMVSEGMFDRYILLSGRSGVGTVEEIRDRTGRRLYPENRGKAEKGGRSEAGGRSENAEKPESGVRPASGTESERKGDCL